jgi:hypothetical protein
MSIRKILVDGTVDLVNYHHIVRYYDMNDPGSVRLDLKTLSDQLMHSFVFVVRPRPGVRDVHSYWRTHVRGAVPNRVLTVGLQVGSAGGRPWAARQARGGYGSDTGPLAVIRL